MAIDVLNMSGEKVSEVKVGKDLAGPVKESLFYEASRMHLANLRSGCASTKNRAEVSGSGQKPWKQKGTGRARAGSKRSPIWRHGGVVFGPKPRDYSYRMPKSAMLSALKSALSYKIREGKLRLFSTLALSEPKTRIAREVFKKAGIGSALVVVDGEERNLYLALRNLDGFKLIGLDALSVYDILRYDIMVMTKSAFEKVEARVA